MILPMQDEETGAEPRVLHASICDPYLLLIRDDSSAFIAQMNSDDELEEVEKPEGVLTSTKWVSGCLYADTKGVFGQKAVEDGEKSIFMFMLSSTGSFQVRFQQLCELFHLLILLRSLPFRIFRHLFLPPRGCAIFLRF